MPMESCLHVNIGMGIKDTKIISMPRLDTSYYILYLRKNFSKFIHDLCEGDLGYFGFIPRRF